MSFFLTLWRWSLALLRKHYQAIILALLFLMFPLGYLESMRWPFPGPKATHGVLKGLFLILMGVLATQPKVTSAHKSQTQLYLVLLFVLSFVVSAAFSQVPDTSLLFLWYPLIAVAISFAFARVRLNNGHLLLFTSISIVLIMATFAFSFFSLMFRYEVDSLYYFLFLDHRANQLLDELRYFGKYVSLGPYIMLVPLSTVFLTQSSAPLVRKLLSILVLMVGVLTAVISNNRIDVIIISLQFLILLWLIPRRLAILTLILLIPAIQFGLFTTQKFFGFNLEDRFLRPRVIRDLETIDMRFTYWQTALYNFQNYPLFGTGPNTYNDVSVFPLRRYYDQGVREYTVRQDIGIGVHNLFIERLADTGLLGFISFVALLYYLFKLDIIRLLRFKDRQQRNRYLLFSLSSWSWILYGITDNGYGAQGFVTFFFLRGMLTHL